MILRPSGLVSPQTSQPGQTYDHVVLQDPDQPLGMGDLGYKYVLLCRAFSGEGLPASL